MKPIDEKKRQRVLQRARQATADVEASIQTEKSREDYLDFMTKFAAVENAYKIMLLNYLRDRGQQESFEDLRVESPQVQAVLKYYGISLSDSDRNNIFNGRQAKGKRKARGLRNSLAHRPNPDALNELDSKKSQLFASMDAFRASIVKEVQ